MMLRLLLLLCLGQCLPAVFVAEKATYADVGRPVTLDCYGPAATDTEEAHVMWMFDGRPVGSNENGSWNETDHYVGRTRLGSIQQNNFSLVINPVRKEDAGVYTCRINGEDKQIIHLKFTGVQNQTAAVTSTKDPVRRPNKERDDPSGSITKDQQNSDENRPVGQPKTSPQESPRDRTQSTAKEATASPQSLPSTQNPGNEWVIVGILGIALAAAVLIIKWKKWKYRQRTSKPADLKSTEYSLIDMNNGDSVNQRTEEPANERLADMTICCSWRSPTVANNGGRSNELNMPPYI